MMAHYGMRTLVSVFIGSLAVTSAKAAPSLEVSRPEAAPYLELWNVAAASGIAATAEFYASSFSGSFGPYGDISVSFTPNNPVAPKPVVAGVFVDRAGDGVIRDPDPFFRAQTPYVDTTSPALVGDTGFFVAPGGGASNSADIGLVELTFTSQVQNSFSLLWGSIDVNTPGTNGNFLSFYDGATLLYTLRGDDVRNEALANGDPISGPPAQLGPNGSRLVTIRGLPDFDRIVADANQKSFEFAVVNAPLPAIGGGILAYIVMSVFALGAWLRSRMTGNMQEA